MSKKEEYRKKLCYELGSEYSLRKYCSFKQIYRKLDDGYELEIGFFDLRSKLLIIVLLKDQVMVEAVYSTLPYKEVEQAIKQLVEKHTGRNFKILTDDEKIRPNI